MVRQQVLGEQEGKTELRDAPDPCRQPDKLPVHPLKARTLTALTDLADRLGLGVPQIEG